MSEAQPKTLAPIKGLQIKVFNDPRTVERIKVLDKYLFPVKYSDQHYTNVINNGFHHFNQLAFYNDALVGVVTCRLEHTDVEGELRLYVMTIGVLKPYRRLGIATRLMQQVIDNVANKETKNKITHIALHVQIGQDAALAFYLGFGFADKGVVKDYYTDLEVRDATLLEKVVPQNALVAKKEVK
eukprot:GILI01042485.1.p1 GENE.GILI01042485.1~~GILI01042485.1.p1  ORF type:complete len:199 (+),score=39.62 GILI01042485.1:47-598(+)